MPVESAADRAAFVNSDDFGAAATFTPSGGGGATSLSVLLDKPTERMGAGQAGFEGAAYTARARQDDLASNPRGGTLVVGAQTFKVSRATQDETAGFWLLDLELQ